MTGTVTALSKARLSAPFGALLENPNTVIAALVLSVCVAATAGYVVTSRALGFMFGTPVAITLDDDPAGPAERPAPRVRTASAPADPAVALGFLDSLPARALPPPLEEADIQNPPRGIVPLRVIAGRPAVVPPQRPVRGDGPVRLAQGMSAARALALPGPMARPQEASAGASVTAVAAEVALLGQGTSPRPAQRPATLSTRAPGPAEAEAAITLAASVAPESAPPRPRLLEPVAPRAGANPCSARLAREIPRRPGSAAGGSAVMAALGDGSGSGRDGAIVAEALRGNIPDHLRDLQPVRFAGIVGGRQTEVTICVMPDYLAIGSDQDHVRVPLGLPAALRVAEAFDMMLPTTRMVDAIYAQADVRLAPSPMPPTSAMSSTSYFLRHDATVSAQFDRAGARPGLLVAGHKKDVVIANRLANAPGRVAIYGWHRSNGDPIQPLSTVHGEYYADYSHGIRLVARTAYVDGRAVDLRGLLTDGQYAGLLNSDGPLSGATVRLAALR
jgi:hypothetical protein